ncbi:MAG: PEP-CTERM sorting domain-containing protein [Verrucomicrobiales bacterium]|jgi:hypothetical protein|nr:PEP-CTERM sorting domain-containing protein [Verrucomicrobiales bacterium]
MHTKLLTALLTATLGLAAADLRAQELNNYTTYNDFTITASYELPYSTQGGFTVYNGNLYSWNFGNTWEDNPSYAIYNLASQTILDFNNDHALDGNSFGDPFGLYDPDTSTFYAGTYDDKGATGVWRYDGNGDWTKLGAFASLYGADLYQGRLYASGLNEIWNHKVGQNNQIALYDLTGHSQHDVIIQTTGNSATVAVDRQGNVYYANFNGTIAPSLYMWTAEQVNSVRADLENGGAGGSEDDLYLTYDDGLFLTSVPGGANGITVDDAGNVFVSYTKGGYDNGILMWNESLGLAADDGETHYLDVVTFSGFGVGSSPSFLDTEGDILNGGTLYIGPAFSGYDFLFLTYNIIPEPSTWALLVTGLGLLLILSARRGKESLCKFVKFESLLSSKAAADAGSGASNLHKLNKPNKLNKLFPFLTLAALLSLPPAARAVELGPFSGGQATPGALDSGIPGFVGPAGDGVTSGDNYVNPVFVAWATGCADYSPFGNLGTYDAGDPSTGRPIGLAFYIYPELAFGPATGIATDAVSLGEMYLYEVQQYLLNPTGTVHPGTITMTFDQAITNGSGADFAVFENAFVSNFTNPEYGYVAGQGFCELGYVEVSTGGEYFARFPSIYLNTPATLNLTLNEDGTPKNFDYATQEVTTIYNLAGKHSNAYGASYGTPFDLDTLVDISAAVDALAAMGIDLSAEQLASLLAQTDYNQSLIDGGLLDVNNINFVRIVDIPGTGTFTDSLGNPIYDSWPTWGSGGFDLEAVGVLNQVNPIPEPAAWALLVTGLGLTLTLSIRRNTSPAPANSPLEEGWRVATGCFSVLRSSSENAETPRRLRRHPLSVAKGV